MKKALIIPIVCLSIMLALYPGQSLFAANYFETPMNAVSPRLSGLGGRHAAFADGFTTIYTNPAGFFASGEEISWAEFSVGAKGPVFSLADAVLSGSLDMATLGDLLVGLYTGLSITGPLSFGYVGNGLGLGVIMNSDVVLYSYNPLSATAVVKEDILLTGGYSFPINIMPENHILEGGVLLKGGFRGELNAGLTTAEILAFDPASLLDGEPFSFISMIGMDLGLLYNWKESFFVGLTGKDVYTPTSKKAYASVNEFLDGTVDPDPSYGVVPFTLNLGFRYRFDLARFNIFLSDIDLYLDYEDLLDFWLYPTLAINPVLHVGFGTEITMLDILDVRLGFSQGLPSAGLGLDLHWFTMNAAMFGSERSTEPGMSPVYNLQLGFEFRF